ncbi:leucine-rich repeat domain-containing protein [Bifidobacterium animalis]|uniref:leucine-rich repeat domain-containing protein n=1 Tax=Bifidobacterium animalis TaxID=28025 RepID=UPI0018C1DE39|nr:leucine-rich repeat domain-containing protein [Bifidobacterium animalis]
MMNTLKEMTVSVVATLAGVMMVAPTAMATNSTIPIDAAHSPEHKFRSYIAFEFDKNGDNRLSVNERNAVTRIFLPDNSTSAKGIEYFPNLNFLFAGNSPLHKIDISKNQKLDTLYISNAQLTSIDLSKNPNLRDVLLDNNNLTTVDATKNKKLTNLDVDETPYLPCTSPLR